MNWTFLEKNRISATWGLALLLSAGLPVTAQVPLNPLPQRTVGNLTLRQNSAGPNLVEGREVNRPLGLAVDATRKILWVADTANNRVLGWQNSSAFENGARADYVLGQRDFLSTEALGPGTSFSAGLNAPMGVAVDASGNVYVLDAGNNRVIRFPTPFSQPDQLPDLVLGQPDFRTRGANQGGAVTEKTLATAVGASVFKCGLAFDGENNLWVVDAGNNRLLRFGANVLGRDAPSFPSSNLVVGQPDFVSNGPVLGAIAAIETRTTKSGLREPSGIAFDQGGRMYVVDLLNRAVVYRPPFANGMNASRIMGIVPLPAEGQPALTPVNEYSIGVSLANGSSIPADSVFTAGNVIFILDTPSSRILRFEPFDAWPAENVSYSPRAQAVIAQDGFTATQFQPNRNRPEPSNATLSSPSGGAFANGEVFIADSENNRILAFGDLSTGPAASAGAPYAARRVLGQDSFAGRSVNLIEGREFAFNTGNLQSGAVKIDARSNPPRMYVADTNNHRVLGFADARRVRGGDKADIVIGQPDFSRALVNYPSNNLNERGPASLAFPSDVAIDNEGNVWVADTGNSRVLRFPDPFANPGAQADLVIGQTGFSSRLQDATSRTMSAPFGMAFSVEGVLFVSDATLNRVLQFNPPFISGMAATRAFGQPDLISSATGTADNRLNGPRHISFDTDDRLYVADAGNNRVQIFARAPLAGLDPRSAFSLTRNLSRPLSVHVSKESGAIWVANSGAGAALRYPNFDRLVSAGDNSDLQIPAFGPVAITTDPFGNLFMADLRNRIAIHFPRVDIVNGANYLPRITPGMIASLFSDKLNYAFTDKISVNQTVPLARELGDLKVSVNGQPVPLYFTSAFQINFQMPKDLATGSTAELQVEQVSSGRIIAATEIPIDVASPALFTLSATGTGQLAAINVEDNNTINGVGEGLKAVGRGKIISLYGTGQGPIDGAPADGAPPSGPVNTDIKPIVIVNNQRLADDNILYSGLAPGLVGVWQLNLRIPETVPPSGRINVLVNFRGISSNNPQNVNQIVTTIAVQ